MTYVTDQTPQQLRAHMRMLQKTPGWHSPLDDRLFKEILDQDTEIERLRQMSRQPALGQIVGEIHRRAEKEWADDGHDFTVTITAEEYRALCAEEASRAALSGEGNGSD